MIDKRKSKTHTTNQWQNPVRLFLSFLLLILALQVNAYDVPNSSARVEFEEIEVAVHPVRSFKPEIQFLETGALNSSEQAELRKKIRELSQWALALFLEKRPNFNWEENHFVIPVRIVEEQTLISIATTSNSGLAPKAFTDYVSAQFPQGVLYLSKNLDLSGASRPILVHEIVHMFQKYLPNGRTLDCENFAQREYEAYAIQARFRQVDTVRPDRMEASHTEHSISSLSITCPRKTLATLE